MSEGKSNFESKCAERVGDIAGRGKLRYVVCVDGSEAADEAFLATMALRRKHDFVAVYHASKEAKEGVFVQPNWRPAAIQQRYDVELTARMLPERYATVMDARGDRSFMDTLSHSLSQYEDSKLLRAMGNHYPDFIVFGVVGRKGSKDEKGQLGTNALGALAVLHYPCLVIKRPITEGRRKFIFACNLSSQSKQGLDVVFQLANSKDSLELVHFYDDSNGDDSYFSEMREYYSRELDTYGPADTEIRILPKPRGLAITKAIADYVNEAGCDFFAIAPRAKISISSITTYIVNHVDANVILCKV